MSQELVVKVEGLSTVWCPHCCEPMQVSVEVDLLKNRGHVTVRRLELVDADPSSNPKDPGPEPGSTREVVE
jgi:hypothetical protein